MSTNQVELRAFAHVTRMQPRYAAFEAIVADGDIPLVGMSQLFVEIAPGNEVFRIADRALKATAVRAGSQVVEREFGFLACMPTLRTRSSRQPLRSSASLGWRQPTAFAQQSCLPS